MYSLLNLNTLIKKEIKPSGMRVFSISHRCAVCGSILQAKHETLFNEHTDIIKRSLADEMIRYIGIHYLGHDEEAIDKAKSEVTND